MPRFPFNPMLALLMVLAAPVAAPCASAGNQITILYDAFSEKPSFTLDWGYAALVEFEGRRILFDTGNDAAMFEANIKRLHVDLSKVDLVVLSHRHGDHTSGLGYVLSMNPNVPVYVPSDETFMQATPAGFFAPAVEDTSLPGRMRYFGGAPPTPPPAHGTAWPAARFHAITKLTDITPHIHLISTLSNTPGFRDMQEVSLILDTPQGPIVIVGCSHPGIEAILANVVGQTHASSIFELVGGLHLVVSTPSQIDQTISALLDTYHVHRTALGHCTGEKAFAILQKRLGENYRYAGVGEVLGL
jgi:7,8-dihydropterin-6-yl-methyl-4-(beta-D-ribofuranosyl)aminobenzene 5'-phosphate synthase